MAVTGADIDDLLLTTFSIYTNDKHGCLSVRDGYDGTEWVNIHGAFHQMLKSQKWTEGSLGFRAVYTCTILTTSKYCYHVCLC